jgi:hypothetical protein
MANKQLDKSLTLIRDRLEVLDVGIVSSPRSTLGKACCTVLESTHGSDSMPDSAFAKSDEE